MAGIGSLNRAGRGLGMRQGGSKYASERYNPTMPRCGTLYITFDGEFVQLQGGERSYVYVAASGRRVGSRFDYSLERQDDSGEGPIPAGSYWINPDELWQNAWYKFTASSSAWGNYRITLHPYPTTETYGRGGFFIHGGDELGSAGCIDLATSMDAFVKNLHSELGKTRICHIQVTVRYRSPR